MNTNKKTVRILEDVKISTKMKLSALWAAVMFCYIFGDINSFFSGWVHGAKYGGNNTTFFSDTRNHVMRKKL